MINEDLRKEVLIVHDDLNACGGSERLAATTIETLAQIGFDVDLATFTIPDVAKIQRQFRINLTGSIRKIHFTNLYSVLNIDRELLDVNNNSYDIVMNTHADQLPFYEKHNDNDTAIKGKKSKINLTYCHYPLLPYQIRNGMYRTFLEKYMPGISSFSLHKLFAKASSQYNLMMNNNTILTNSIFSAKAIKQLYHNVDPIVLSPPVDIDKFRNGNLSYCSSYGKKQNIVLVVSKFSADKEIENAITLTNLLKVVPTIGGSSDFVPSEYKYDTIQQAADVIANILNEINDNDNALVRSDKISNIVSKFSIQTYKKNLNNIIDYVIKTRKLEEAVIFKRQTRLSETTRPQV